MRNDGQPSAKRRPGAGRKPKAATILKRRLIENKLDEAEASFAYLVAERDDRNASPNLRHAAAVMIYEIVCGKATQKNELTGKDGGPIQIFDYAAIDRLITRRPESDPSEPGTN